MIQISMTFIQFKQSNSCKLGYYVRAKQPDISQYVIQIILKHVINAVIASKIASNFLENQVQTQQNNNITKNQQDVRMRIILFSYHNARFLSAV